MQTYLDTGLNVDSAVGMCDKSDVVVGWECEVPDTAN